MKILLTILLIFYTSAALWAQAEEDTTARLLNDVIIEENRLQIPFTQASRSIGLITRQDMAMLPAQSVPEVLSYVPGVDVRQRGPVGVQADLSIRGSTFEQTLVLLNGIKMSDPQTGHHMLNLPLNLDNIEKIVVVKGPAARAFGQNAYAGAVNIITKIPEKRGVTVSGYGGDFGTYGATASIALPSETYGQYLSFSRDASDGYRHNTDYYLNNIFYQSELKAFGGVFKLQGGYTDREFGANGFYASPTAINQWETVQTLLGSVAYEKKTGALLHKTRLYWRRNDDRYQFVRGKPEIYENIHQTNVYGAEYNASYESDWGTSGFGVEYRREEIQSSNLKNWQRNNFGLFAEHRFAPSSQFDITPGVYVNHYSEFGWNAFPGVDVGYLVAQKVRLFANAGRSFRIPTYTDLYYADPANLGNPDLQPESAWTYEVGGKYSGKGFFVQADYFQRQSNNQIDWLRATPQDKWRPENISDLTTQGIEVLAELFPKELTTKQFPIERVTLGYTYLNNEIRQSEAFLSRYVLSNLRHQLVAGLDYSFLRHFSHTIRYRALDRVSMASYQVVDTRLTFKQEAFSVYVEATNLFDEAYTEVNLVPMPGRWLRAGAQFRIGF